MEELARTILTTILAGGPQAVVAILLAALGGMALELRRLRALVAKKDERIDEIIDRYAEGAVSLSTALTELKGVLVEIKGKV